MWIFDQNLWNGNFPGGPGVKTVLTTQRVWFPSLIRELRSQMPHGLAKKKVWYQGRGRPWTFWLFIPCYEKKIWCRQYWREKWTWIKDWMIPAQPLAPSCLHSITLFPGVDGPEWKGVAFWHDNAQTLTISVLPALKRAELFMPATPFFPRLKKKKKKWGRQRWGNLYTMKHWRGKDEAEPSPCLGLFSLNVLLWALISLSFWNCLYSVSCRAAPP